MTAKIDTIVQAAAPVLVPRRDPVACGPRRRASNETPEQRTGRHEEQRALEGDRRGRRHRPVGRASSGKKGLATDHLDPSSMGGKELAHYKELKKNEASSAAR